MLAGVVVAAAAAFFSFAFFFFPPRIMIVHFLSGPPFRVCHFCAFSAGLAIRITLLFCSKSRSLNQTLPHRIYTQGHIFPENVYPSTKHMFLQLVGYWSEVITFRCFVKSVWGK